MRFGSLFSGVDGLGLGLEWAGMECAWQVEIIEFCRKILGHHWPDVPRYGDVRDVGRHNLEAVDLIAGGFPCQPHSVAGKRRGAEDDRNLWPEFSRIIAELRPRYVLAENVPGIVSTYLDTVLSDLESKGYACATFNIPACAFDAPHRRERIFIVAFSSSVQRDPGAEISGIFPRMFAYKQEHDNFNRPSEDVADANQERQSGLSERETTQNASFGIGGKNVRHASGQRSQNWVKKKMEGSKKRNTLLQSQRPDWWTIEPDVGRVAHGIPSRVDRLRALGNAAVPQVAEWIGRRILEFDKATGD